MPLISVREPGGRPHDAAASTEMDLDSRSGSELPWGTLGSSADASGRVLVDLTRRGPLHRAASGQGRCRTPWGRRNGNLEDRGSGAHGTMGNSPQCRLAPRQGVSALHTVLAAMHSALPPGGNVLAGVQT